MLSNPYNPLGIQWETNHVIQCRTSQEDFFFLKQKFPYYPGLFDKVLSNLYKILLDELRRRDSETHIETALYIDDPSYRILDDIIAGLERRTIGEYSVGGNASSQPDPGRTDSVHTTMQCSTQLGSNAESSSSSGKRSSKGAEKEKKQRRTGSRSTRTTKEGTH